MTVKTLCSVALMWALVSVSFAQQDVPSGAPIAARGTMVTAANGWRLGTVYRVGPDGSPQIIIDGRMVTIPASTLSVANGKVTTSLDKSQVLALR
jgi:hypothetical protein